MDFSARAKVLALCLALAGSAQAADSGFYFGVNAGQADFAADSGDVGPVLFPIIATLPAGSVLTSASGVSANITRYPVTSVPSGAPVYSAIFASDVEFHHVDETLNATLGYQLNRFLAAELSYVDLGTVEVRTTYPIFSPFPFVTPSSLRQTTAIDVTGIQLSLLGRWPVTQSWSVYGKAGYFFADADIDQSIRVTGSSSTSELDGPKIASENVVLGAGVDFTFATKWVARLEYQRHLNAGGTAFSDEPDVDSVSLGVFLRL